jgi:hypothetical protein
MAYDDAGNEPLEEPLPPLEEPLAIRFARWCESAVEAMLAAVENQHGLWYIGIFQARGAGVARSLARGRGRRQALTRVRVRALLPRDCAGQGRRGANCAAPVRGARLAKDSGA